MRVLTAGQTYYPERNGQAVFTVNLAEGLAARGHQVMVMTPGYSPRSSLQERNRVLIGWVASIPLPFYSEVRWTPWPWPTVEALVAYFRPDVVHIQDHYPLARAVVGVAQKMGIPLLGTNHFLPENLMRNFPGPFRYSRWVERILWATMLDLYNRFDLVTTPTETAAAILRQQNIRVPVRAVSCGVNIHRFRPDLSLDRAAVRRRYGLSAEKAVFLYVGRIDREKRVDVIVRAMYLLGRDDVEFAVGGKGLHVKELRGLVRRLHLEERVKFLGYVPGEDLPAVLNSADVFVMPSEAELQSIATLEAMATGKPVLLANARALPELVEPGVNGYLFRPGDPEDAARHINRLLEERHRWPEMGAASRRIAESHSLERMWETYEGIYAELLGAS